MDLHDCLYLVKIDTELLHSEILRFHNGARILRSGCVEPASVGSGRAPCESVVQSWHCRVILVARFDRAGKEGDLATRRAIPAKVCYNMVSSTL